MSRRAVGLVAAAAFAVGAVAPAALSTDGPPSHIFVRPGEGWLAVARRCGSTVEAMKATNPAEARLVTLYVGEALWCPEGATVPTTTVPATTTTAATTTTSSTTLPTPTTVAPINLADWYTTGLGPPADGVDGGQFRTICEAAEFRYDDPIVYPGQPGVSHLHMFFGNTEADAFSTYESLRASGDSTCSGGPLNRSAYWAPAMLNAAGRVVVPKIVNAYYKAGSTPAQVALTQPLPPGLKMIAGHDMATVNTWQSTRMYWNCGGAQNALQQTIPTDCVPGSELVVRLAFPQCWNGVDLDSANHRSHMAYKSGSSCPPSHPVQIPEYSLLVTWVVPAGGTVGWSLSSDSMPGMTHPAGSTFHADWLGAWEPSISDAWLNGCVRAFKSCNDELGDGRLLRYPADWSGPTVIDAPPKG